MVTLDNMSKIGYIGTGNMGSALAICAKNNTDNELFFANRNIEKAQTLKNKIGGTVSDNKTIASTCDVVFLCVKPQQATDVLTDIKDELLSNKNVVLVSIMTAWTIERIKNIVDVPVIRIMPNTPLLVNEGVILYDYSKDVSSEKVDLFLKLVEGNGLITKLEEKYIDAASAVSGCGPAFADMFVDALADGANRCEVDKQLAIKLAAQMLIGAGKLILESGKDPNTLKTEVCSPGGSTIEGVKVLENNDFKGIVMDAVKASYEKNKKL